MRIIFVFSMAAIVSGCETTQSYSYQAPPSPAQSAQDTRRQYCQGLMAGAMVGTKNIGDGMAKATEAYNKCMLQQ